MSWNHEVHNVGQNVIKITNKDNQVIGYVSESLAQKLAPILRSSYIATKTDQRYDQVMSWIRCKLSFLIMRSALFCLRGSRTIKVNTDAVDDFSFACDEARL